MIALLNAVLQFTLRLHDPQWTCEVTHRDPDIAGTYYLYCSQLTSDGIELITVGRFISDAKASKDSP